MGINLGSGGGAGAPAAAPDAQTATPSGNSGGFLGTLQNAFNSAVSAIPQPIAEPLAAIGEVLARPQQAILHGLQSYNQAARQSGNPLQFLDPHTGLQAAEAAGQGLTDVRGTGDINLRQTLGYDKNVGGLAGAIPDFIGSTVLDPLTFLGGGGRVAEVGAKALRETAPELADKVIAQGAKSLTPEELSSARTAIQDSKAAQNFAKGPEAFATKMFGQPGKAAQLGALLEPAGVKLAGKTIIPKVATRAAADALGITKLGDTVAGSALGKIARGVFIPRAEIAARLGADTAEKVGQIGREADAQAATRIQTIHNQVAHAISQIPDAARTVQKEITPALETGTQDSLRARYIANGQTKEAKLLNVLDSARRATQQIAHAHFPEEVQGRLFSEAKEREVLKTISRQPTKEFQRWIKDNPGSAHKIFGIRKAQSTAELLKRIENGFDKIAPGKSSAELNKKFSGQLGLKQLFHENAVGSILNDASKTIKADRTGTILTKLTTETDAHGTPLLLRAPINHVEAFSEKMANLGFERIGTDTLGDFYGPPEIANYLRSFSRRMSDDASLSALTRGIDKVNGAWKSLTLGMPPFVVPFAMRNFQDNLLQMWQGGFKDFGKLIEANKIASIIGKGAKNGLSARRAIEKSNLSPRLKQLYGVMEREGITSEGFFHVDAGPDAGIALTKGDKLKKAIDITNPDNAITKHGMAFNRRIEEISRMAMWLDSVAQHGDFLVASKAVRTTLFDYNDLTHTEKAIKHLVPFYCVPDDHEIWTQCGWKHHSQLNLGENVMVFDPITHEMRWEPLEEVATFHFSGELRGIERQNNSIWFTPNHRWPYVAQNGGRGIADASELTTGHRLPTKGVFTENTSSLSPRLAAILGWLVTDGYSRFKGNHWEAMVYQSPKKHLRLVEELLGVACTRFHPESGVGCISISAADKMELRKVYSGHKADLPSIIGTLSTSAVVAMWEAMWLAEGSGNQFTQRPGPVLEAFQMLTYMSGKAGWVTGSRSTHVLNLRRSTYIDWKDVTATREYVGTVWCPRTPTGTWFVRHGGMVMPTGNTYMRKNIPLQVRALATNPKTVTIPERAQTALAQALSPQQEGMANAPDYQKAQHLQQWGSIMGTPLLVNVQTPFQGAVDSLRPLGEAVTGNEQAAAQDVLGNFGGVPIGTAKAGAELATGRNIGTGKDLKTGPGQTLAEATVPRLTSIESLYKTGANSAGDTEQTSRAKQIAKILNLLSGASVQTGSK